MTDPSPNAPSETTLFVAVADPWTEDLSKSPDASVRDRLQPTLDAYPAGTSIVAVGQHSLLGLLPHTRLLYDRRPTGVSVRLVLSILVDARLKPEFSRAGPHDLLWRFVPPTPDVEHTSLTEFAGEWPALLSFFVRLDAAIPKLRAEVTRRAAMERARQDITTRYLQEVAAAEAGTLAAARIGSSAMLEAATHLGEVLDRFRDALAALDHLEHTEAPRG